MGKGKGGKGKDEWKGEGGKGRYDRYDRFKGEGRGAPASPFAAGVAAAPLLAVPQFADGSWGKELSGGLHAFDRGHILFSTKELYFEVLGQCSVHLAVPAPTKIDGRDRQEFANSGPVELAGRSFRNLQELRTEIVTLRKAHSNPPRRLEPAAERLMRSVFEHHPQATEKLKDLQFIQVASNPQSDDPTDVTFFVMRNEQDGDDVSYVKCLRAMVTKEGEQMLPLATLSHDHGLNLRVASGNVQIGPSSQGFGVRVDLERLALSVHLTEGLRGPWQLELGRQHSDLPHVPLRVVVEVAEGEAAAIRWAAPFDFAQPGTGQELALPALEDQRRPEELKRSLEAMMKDQNIPGDLSSLSMEELQRIALQIVVKGLGASLHVTRSAGACAVQNQSLLRIAREQGMELTCQQLQDARHELQKVKEERDTAEATLNQLREEIAVLRRKVTQVEGERAAPVLPDAPPRRPQAPRATEAAATELAELRRKLQVELPDPAGSMLRNSLKLMSSELYSGPSRALWELLQNADDCSYDQAAELQIEHVGNDLWIEYNERGFSWEDVEALCSGVALIRFLWKRTPRLIDLEESWGMLNSESLRKFDPATTKFKHCLWQHWLEIARDTSTLRISEATRFILLKKGDRGLVSGLSLIGDSFPDNFYGAFQNALRLWDVRPNIQRHNVSHVLLSLDWERQEGLASLENLQEKTKRQAPSPFMALQPQEVAQMVQVQLRLSYLGVAEVQEPINMACVEVLAELLECKLKILAQLGAQMSGFEGDGFFFDETAPCPLPHVTPQQFLATTALPRPLPERGTAVYLPLRRDFPELLNEIVPESLLFLRRLHQVTVGHQSFSLRHENNGHSTLLVADSSGTKDLQRATALSWAHGPQCQCHRFVMGCGASAGPGKPPDPPSETEKATERKADRSEDKKAAQLENKDRLDRL
eukprot:s1128_g3.t1